MNKTNNKVTVVLENEDVGGLRAELEDAFCALDRATDSKLSYSLNRLRKISPKLVEFYTLIGGN